MPRGTQSARDKRVARDKRTACGLHVAEPWPLGLGTGTDNRTAIFTSISPQNRYFAPVYRSTQCCSD